MLASLTTLLTYLAFTGASPLRRSTKALSTSNAYQLQVQLLDPAKDLDPPVAGEYLSTMHVGAGYNAAVVSTHNVPGATYTPFYTNGTDAYTSVLNDLGTMYPWGIHVQAPDSFDYTFPGEHDVDINVGGGTNGIGLVASGDSVVLGGLAPGYYAVCNRFVGYVRANETVVRYVYEGEELPEGCVGVQFAPLCDVLEDLPEGSWWTHDFVQEVPCVAPAASPRFRA
ncbi:hypothetical protein F4677DRAFT_415548 [Hypoxylon crocopeplum]|nr:hypothetical protein F4677DRAFT_415548 [Hypoxylon crocopeplum]